MKQRQFVYTILALLASGILEFALLNFTHLKSQSMFLVIWTFIILQAIAMIIVYQKKLMTAAVTGAVWVGISILIQLLPQFTKVK